MRKQWNWNVMRRKAPLFAILMLAGAAACGSMVGLTARYVHRESRSAVALSNQFYFTSDYLSETGNSYTLAPGTTEITIQLRNYADEYRWSDMDIPYQASVTMENQSGMTGGLSYENTGTLTRTESIGTEQNFTISGLAPGTYHVKVESTSPFSRTLQGTFTVQEQDLDIHYTVSDSVGSPYVILQVSTKAYGGGIVISWPAGLIPDTSEVAFAQVNTYDEATESYKAGSITMDAFGRYGSENFRFFKTDMEHTYEMKEFEVKKTAQQQE